MINILMSQQTTVYHYIERLLHCTLLYTHSLFGIHNKNTLIFACIYHHLMQRNLYLNGWYFIHVHLFSSAISAIVCMKNKRWTYL